MKNQDWIDILPPAAPADEISWWLWLIISTAALLLLMLGYAWYSSPRQAALRTLKALARQLDKTSAYKEIPLQARNALKQALRINHLDEIDVDHLPRWQNYRSTLSRLCFSRSTPSREELASLLTETRGWIKEPDSLYG